MSTLKIISREDLGSILNGSEEYELTGGYDGYLADLSYTDLSNHCLNSAPLIDANLTDANLTGSDLICTKLDRAKLIRANLTGACLVGAELNGADLTGANLTGADLRDAKLITTALEGAKLTDAILSHWPLPSAADLCQLLVDHASSDLFAMRSWSGDTYNLIGAAGLTIENPFLGSAVIMQVLPEFDIKILSDYDEKTTLAELYRVAALYGGDII